MSQTPEISSTEVRNLASSPALVGLDLARLVEGSEARAYASLFAHTQKAHPDGGFGHTSAGSRVALRAKALKTTLLFNRVLGLGVFQPASTDQVLDLIAAYSQGTTPFGVEVSPAAVPGDLPAMLKSHRLRRTLPVQVLYRDGSAPPPRYAAWQRATGMSVEAVGPDFAPTVAAVCCENFKMPEGVANLLVTGSCAPGWRRWLAMDGQTAVGASLSYVSDGVAWLGWTSVNASHRGRWVHAGIVARQLEDAHAAGCQWVTTETAVSSKEKPDAAHHNLRNFGFLDAYQRPLYVYQPRPGA